MAVSGRARYLWTLATIAQSLPALHPGQITAHISPTLFPEDVHLCDVLAPCLFALLQPGRRHRWAGRERGTT